MPLRAPPCQPSGEFHGRAEALSGSVEEQPIMTVASAVNRSTSRIWVARSFTLGAGGMRPALHHVALNHFIQFPTGHDVGNAAIFLTLRMTTLATNFRPG